MKKVLLSAMAALALSGTGTVFAADGYQLSAGEFEEFRHSYDLKTGEKVYFTQQGKQRFFVQLGGQKPERIYAKSKGVFVTQSGARVKFADRGYAVTIDNYELMSPKVVVAMQCAAAAC